MDDLEARIFGALRDETWIYPGLGNDTTLGAERAAPRRVAGPGLVTHRRRRVGTTAHPVIWMSPKTTATRTPITATTSIHPVSRSIVRSRSGGGAVVASDW